MSTRLHLQQDVVSNSQIADTDAKNKTVVGEDCNSEEEETKAVSNSHLWEDIAQSNSHSYLMSQSRFQNLGGNTTSNQSLTLPPQYTLSESNLIALVDGLHGQPEEMKKQLMTEFTKSNDIVQKLVERVKGLEA